jgi:hypothetical protein
MASSTGLLKHLGCRRVFFVDGEVGDEDVPLAKPVDDPPAIRVGDDETSTGSIDMRVFVKLGDEGGDEVRDLVGKVRIELQLGELPGEKVPELFPRCVTVYQKHVGNKRWWLADRPQGRPTVLWSLEVLLGEVQLLCEPVIDSGEMA